MAGLGSIRHLSQLLDLFGDGRARVSIDDITQSLGLTRTTAYRTARALCEIGLLEHVFDEGYALGPRILELHRLLQRGSPLLAVARPVMVALAAEALPGSTVLLCRAYRDQVMCVHQEIVYGPQDPVSYQVGRPMPLYRGASSLVVLAALPRSRLAHLYERDAAQIAGVGLGDSREDFLARLAAIRRAGQHVSRGEVDPGRIGVATLFADKALGIVGSLSLVLSQAGASEIDVSRAALQVSAAAHDITSKLQALHDTLPLGGAKTGRAARG